MGTFDYCLVFIGFPVYYCVFCYLLMGFSFSQLRWVGYSKQNQHNVKNKRVKQQNNGCDTLWPDTLVIAGRLGLPKSLCSGSGEEKCR